MASSSATRRIWIRVMPGMSTPGKGSAPIAAVCWARRADQVLGDRLAQTRVTPGGRHGLDAQVRHDRGDRGLPAGVAVERRHVHDVRHLEAPAAQHAGASISRRSSASPISIAIAPPPERRRATRAGAPTERSVSGRTGRIARASSSGDAPDEPPRISRSRSTDRGSPGSRWISPPSARASASRTTPMTGRTARKAELARPMSPTIRGRPSGAGGCRAAGRWRRGWSGCGFRRSS